MKVTVSRAIEGISLNGSEFLLTDDRKEIMTFQNEQQVFSYFAKLGMEPAVIQDTFILHYECESEKEANDTIAEAADSFKQHMQKKEKVDFSDYDEWAGCIEAAQFWLEKQKK